MLKKIAGIISFVLFSLLLAGILYAGVHLGGKVL